MDLELGSAIRKVAAGETVFDPQVEQRAALKGERAQPSRSANLKSCR